MARQISPETRAALWEYWGTPYIERPNPREIRRKLFIGAASFREYKKEYDLEIAEKKAEQRSLYVARAYKPNFAAPTEITPNEVKAFKRKLYQDAMAPSAQKGDKELCGRALGIFVDKQEVTHLISPEIIEASRKRAEDYIDTEFTIEEVLPDKAPESLDLIHDNKD